MTRFHSSGVVISSAFWCLLPFVLGANSIQAQETGEYRVHVDDRWRTTDESHAQLYFYSWQHLNVDRWLPDFDNKKNCRWTGSIASSADSAMAAHGSLVVSYPNGRVYLSEHYCEGRLCQVTECYRHNGLLNFTIDYDKRWQGRPWSYYIEWYKKGEATKASFMYLDTEKHRWVEICTIGCQKNTALFHPAE